MTDADMPTMNRRPSNPVWRYRYLIAIVIGLILWPLVSIWLAVVWWVLVVVTWFVFNVSGPAGSA